MKEFRSTNAFTRFYRFSFVVFLLYSQQSFSQISFQPYQAIHTGSFPEVVCIGDVNNDGLNDVVLGTSFYFDTLNDYKIFVYLQNAQGGLNNPVIYPYPPHGGIKTITIADVNNDQLNDVIIGYDDSIGIFFQNISGTLNPIQGYYSGATVDAVKTGDLNHDGLTDIGVSHWNDNFLRVFYQTASGFSTTTYLNPSAGYDEIDVADVNNDGLDDVVYLAGQGLMNDIRVFYQNTAGSLNPYVSYPPPILHFRMAGIALGDFNNDGRKDVACTIYGSGGNSKVAVWFQDTVLGVLDNPPEIINANAFPEPIEIADLNCDGKNEILVAHGDAQRLSCFEQDSTGHYNSYKLFAIPYASHYKPQGLSIGDINNDGLKDVAIADYNNGLVLLINNAAPANLCVQDTLIATDTIYRRTFSQQSYYSIVSYDTLSNYLITETDWYKVTIIYREDSISLDTFFYRTGVSCKGQFFDTLVKSHKYYTLVCLESDTMLMLIKKDSVNITSHFNLYPNPSEGLFWAEIRAPYDNKNLKIQVYDDLGAFLLQEIFPLAGNKKRIDLRSLSPGVYFIRFSSLQSSLVKKVIIVR